LPISSIISNPLLSGLYKARGIPKIETTACSASQKTTIEKELKVAKKMAEAGYNELRVYMNLIKNEVRFMDGFEVNDEFKRLKTTLKPRVFYSVFGIKSGEALTNGQQRDDLYIAQALKRWEKVLSIFDPSKTIKFCCTDKCKTPSANAETDDGVIVICKNFWDVKGRFDGQARVILHEILHLQVSGTRLGNEEYYDLGKPGSVVRQGFPASYRLADSWAEQGDILLNGPKPFDGISIDNVPDTGVVAPDPDDLGLDIIAE
jgi:hypothetical protein